MATANVLFVPRKPRGSRWIKSANQEWFRVMTRRAIGATVDVAWCGWVYFPVNPSGTKAIWNTRTDTGTRIGWGLYATSARALRISWGHGVDSTPPGYNSANGAADLAKWNFIVVNLDRSGNASVYCNDMTTAVIEEDMSASVAVDWSTCTDKWFLGASSATSTNDLRLAGVGLIIGGLLSLADRTELLNAGQMLKYTGFSAGLVTTFADQDYWEMGEKSGDAANSVVASAARILEGRTVDTKLDTIATANLPRRTIV